MTRLTTIRVGRTALGVLLAAVVLTAGLVGAVGTAAAEPIDGKGNDPYLGSLYSLDGKGNDPYLGSLYSLDGKGNDPYPTGLYSRDGSTVDIDSPPADPAFRVVP